MNNHDKARIRTDSAVGDWAVPHDESSKVLGAVRSKMGISSVVKLRRKSHGDRSGS